MAAEALSLAVSRFSKGETQPSDIVAMSGTNHVSVADMRPGDEVEVSQFSLNNPQISWKVKLQVADTGVLRVVVHDVTAEDRSRLLLRGTVHISSRSGEAEEDAVEAVFEADNQPQPLPGPPGPGAGLRSPRHQRIVVDAEGPATIASMNLASVSALGLSITTFYLHPSRRPDDEDSASESVSDDSPTEDMPDDSPAEEAVDGEPPTPDKDARMLHRLSVDLGHLLRTQTEADVTLLVEELPIRAHRAVLAARSDVLRRLLQRHPAASEPLALPNAPREAFLMMLDFVYTGDVSGLQGLEEDVLVLAGRFGLADLADACCRRLLRALRADHTRALDLLAFADRHAVHRLKQSALLVAVEHLCEVTASRQWQEYKRTVPSLAADLLETTAHVLSKPSS